MKRSNFNDRYTFKLTQSVYENDDGSISIKLPRKLYPGEAVFVGIRDSINRGGIGIRGIVFKCDIDGNPTIEGNGFVTIDYRMYASNVDSFFYKIDPSISYYEESDGPKLVIGVYNPNDESGLELEILDADINLVFFNFPSIVCGEV